MIIRCLYLLVCFALCACSSAKANYLSSDQAFQLLVKAKNSHELTAQWKIAPGYYLYKERLQLTTSPQQKQLGTINFPVHLAKIDDYFGRQEIYKDQLEITIPIRTTAPFKLHLEYQGCYADKYCYPPVTQTFFVNPAKLVPGMTVAAEVKPEKNFLTKIANLRTEKSFTQFFQNSHFPLLLLSFFIMGFLLSLTPCILPMLPILSGIIAGHKQISTRRGFILSSIYVVGVSLTYAIAGIIVAWLGQSVQAAFQSPWIIALFSFLFVLLALSLFGYYELRFPHWLQDRLYRFEKEHHPGGYLGVFIMGVFAALIVSPCVSAPLMGALIYISTTGNMLLGGSVLFAAGLGMGVPLILVGTLGAHYLPKTGSWMNRVKAIFGILLLAVAIWLLARIIPELYSMVLFAALIIGSGLFIGAFHSNYQGPNYIYKTLSIMMLTYGIAIFAGTLMGNASFTTPLQFPQNGSSEASRSQVAAHPQFIKVKDLSTLNTYLEKAKKAGRSVIVDYYADWCVSCLELEHSTFLDRRVQQAFQKFMLLRLDITPNNEQSKLLLAKYNAFAPPTLAFINHQGKFMRHQNLMGMVTAEELLEHLQEIGLTQANED